MNKRIINLLILSLIFGNLSVSSQNNNSNQLPKLIPPSPNVVAMQRYGDIPIGLYTGTPNISIPIYQISSGEISIPLSISYHASGVKVADEASKVGLGWVLNAGGVISRNIVGTDDFVYTGFNYHNTSTPEIINGLWGPLQTAHFSVQPGCGLSLSGYSSSVNDYIRDGHDFQPDQYNYNCGNYSGKFILKRNKEAILSKKEKIKITCLDNNANAWEMITPDGFIYSFNEYETYTDNENSSAGPPGTYKTAWYLTKITSPKGDEVNFYYTTVSNVYIKPIGSYTETQNPNVFDYTGANPCGSSWSGTLISTSYRTTPGKEYKNIYLDKIAFQDGEVRFQYASDRVDVINDVRLTKIQLYRNTYNPTTTQLFKEWEFTQGYFEGTADQDYNEGTTDQRSKRLKLISLKEKDASGNSLQPHSFKYFNEDVINASNYPAKTSFARDHWGYYNGKVQNTSLVPTFSTMNSTNIVDFYLGIMGSNRDPDPLYSQLFLLNEIQYPTGGKTVLEYEQNDFDYGKSKMYDQSYFANVSEAKPKQLTRIYQGNVYGDQPTAQDLPSKILDLTGLYTSPGATSSSVQIKAFFRFNSYQSGTCTPGGFAGQVNYSLTDENGTTVIEGPIDPIGSSYVVCQGATSPYIGMLITRQYNLAPGKYIWKLHINTGTTWLADVSLTIDYTANAAFDDLSNGGQTLSKAGLGGGLRVKRMLTYDNTTQVNPLIKKYVYSHLGDDGKYYSSGIRMAKPVYSYFQKELARRECQLTGANYVYDSWHQHLMRESDSHVPLNGSSGSPVAYSRVFELTGDNGEYGKTEYQYDNKPDRIPNYSVYDIVGSYAAYVPIRPALNSSISNPGNGNLLRKIDYRYKNNVYEKVAETINTYVDFGAMFYSWYGIEKRIISGSSASTQPCYYQNFIYPAIIESRSLLTSSSSIIYDLNDPGQSTTNVTKYTYDHNTHLQLKNTEQYINNGNLKTTTFTYPADYSDTDAGTVVADMKNNRFMHNSIITSKTVLNTSSSSQLISGMINKYQVLNSKILNQESAVLELAQPVGASSIPDYLPSSGSTYPSNYSAKLLFESYDNVNNITQMRKKDDIPLSYVWDYNKSYPIAEVSNGLQQDIAYSSFEADGTGNWSVPSTTRDNSYSITGSRSYSLSNGAISKSGLTNSKTYVISYWTRSGAYSITGGTTLVSRQGRSFNGWTLYEVEVTTTTTTLTISGSGLIDELRCYPKGSLMTTFTYSPLIGITAQCDPTNKISYFEYDNFGRLQLIKDQENNILKTFEYKYKQ